MYVCVGRDVPFTPETACQTLTAQKEQTNSSVKVVEEVCVCVSPVQDERDSILTLLPAVQLHFGLDNSRSQFNHLL